MQDKSYYLYLDPPNVDMPTGRPPKTKRSEVGARLVALREQAGFSQQEVADKLGIKQPSYAAWERRNVALSIAQLEKLAAIFSVPVVAFFEDEEAVKPRGPIGRAKKAFEAVSQLPRSTQATVLNMVEALVRSHQREQAQKPSAKSA